jgi:hypothetical protein
VIEDEDGFFELRLRSLEDRHKRARSPTARRRIERAMRILQKEMQDIRDKAKVVDIAYARWCKHIDTLLKEK